MSSRRYEGEDFDDHVDRVHGEEVQREVDDKAEEEAKRRAASYSPELLSLQEAFLEGQRAAGFSHGASMNPYQDPTAEHAEWERGRMAGLAARLNSPRRAA